MTNDNQLPEMDDVVSRGDAIYENLEASLLKEDHPGRYVAIHVDSGDFATGRSTAEATRTLLTRHPADGRIFLRQIGDEPDYSVAARLLAGEMIAGSKK